MATTDLDRDHDSVTPGTSATFPAIIAELQRAEAEYAALPYLEAAIERLERAQDAFFATPAPDLAALGAKLDRVFCDDREPDDDCYPAWSKKYLRQTVDDCRRLLRADDRARWQALKAEVLRLEALAAADLAFGPTWTVNEAAKLAAPGTPEWASACEADCEAAEVRLRDYLGPYWAACRALLHCPAPDAEAMRFKVDLVTRTGFESGDPVLPEPFELIRADAERLRGRDA